MTDIRPARYKTQIFGLVPEEHGYGFDTAKLLDLYYTCHCVFLIMYRYTKLERNHS